MATVTIYPTPGTFQDKPLTLHVYGSFPLDTWPQIKAQVADLYECNADDVDLTEVFFGGDCGDDNYRECLTVCGRIVGAFDEALDVYGWRDLFHAVCFGDVHPKTGVVNYNFAAGKPANYRDDEAA